MVDINNLFEEIDAANNRRTRELLGIKGVCGSTRTSDPEGTNSKATIVLCYATWEGFYNDCIEIYFQFLRSRGGRVRDTDWMLLLTAVGRDFDSLRDKHHSANARREFIKNLQTRLDCGFDELDQERIGSRSNLDFERLSYNYDILRFDISSLQKHRIRLDKELVGWRNSVAHGGAPDLSALDISNHVDFTRELLVSVADHFQYAILERP